MPTLEVVISNGLVLGVTAADDGAVAVPGGVFGRLGCMIPPSDGDVPDRLLPGVMKDVEAVGEEGVRGDVTKEDVKDEVDEVATLEDDENEDGIDEVTDDENNEEDVADFVGDDDEGTTDTCGLDDVDVVDANDVEVTGCISALNVV